MGIHRPLLVSESIIRLARDFTDASFRFPTMIENVGFYGSAGICTALMVGASMVSTVLLQWKGRSWR